MSPSSFPSVSISGSGSKSPVSGGSSDGDVGECGGEEEEEEKGVAWKEESDPGDGSGLVAGILFRVLPASEFRWVGRGWEWSPEYVTMNMSGSVLLRSTCFRAIQPLELLHL